MIEVGTKQNSAQRTHEIARSEGHKGQHERGIFAFGREECPSNRARVVTEHHEVVHLKEISQRYTHDRTGFRLFLHGYGDLPQNIKFGEQRAAIQIAVKYGMKFRSET